MKNPQIDYNLWINNYLFNVEATAEAVKEFDRKAKIDENILRHIVIREEE